MTASNAVNVMAGLMVMIGLAGAHVTGQIDMTQFGWLWLVAFVGLNMFQMGLTGFCPARMIFKKLGLKESNCSS